MVSFCFLEEVLTEERDLCQTSMYGVCGVLHAGNFSLGFCDACKKKLGSYLELLLLVLLPVLQAVESLCSISMDRSSEASNTNSG